MLALGQLWEWEIGAAPTPLADLPLGASSLSWSPDGTTVFFSTGDLYAADVETGEIRQVTALPGYEELPAVAPDGEHIAFVTGRPYRGSSRAGQLRVIPSRTGLVQDTAGAPSLGLTPWDVMHSLVWSPDSRSVMAYNAYSASDHATVFTLTGEARDLGELPSAISFIRRVAPDSILYVQGNSLWKASFDAATGAVGEAVSVSNDAAWFPSVARDGTLLYVAEDGLRLRSPSGETSRLGWPVSFQVPPAPAPLLIRNVRIIDGRGGSAAAPRDILIEAGRIASISPTGSVVSPSRVSVLEGGGRTVLPGFVDTHRHLFPAGGGFRQLVGGLYFGTTTFRDAGSEIHMAAAWRDEVAAGRLPGARLVVSTPILHGPSGPPATEGISDWYNQYVVEPDQVARAVRLSRSLGADLVKQRAFSDWASLVTTVEEAHRHGMRISGHCMSTLPAVAAGVDGQEHEANCLRDTGSLQADFGSIKAAAGMWTTVTPAFGQPDLQASTLRTRPDVAPFMPPRTASPALPEAEAERPRRAITDYGRMTRVLHDAGVTLAVGTDRAFPNMTQLTMQALVAAGMTPMEAIRVATYNGALVLGAEEDIGSIEVGKLADLVILEGDPLEDIANTERIWHVIKAGVVVDRESLLSLPSPEPAPVAR